jgi:iron(III) transport system substrate-binding protein
MRSLLVAPQSVKVARLLLATGLFLGSLTGFAAEESVLNLYSARHYATDEALYANFTRATGIKINRVDADDAGILARLKAEGSASPADVILLVDAARLWKGEVEDLFAPVQSPALLKAVPEHLRAKQRSEGTRWFGLSTRARVIG